MFIELHLIQNFAPSCLNRDDTNSPKDCVFGGVRRARVSSQCIKRAMREHAMKHADLSGNLAVRTKRLNEMLAEELKKRDKLEAEIAQVAEFVSRSLGIKTEKNVPHASYLLFLGRDKIAELAEKVTEKWDDLLQEAGKKKGTLDKDLVKLFQATVLDARGNADIAMFGRMIADLPATNVDAACQVAHAISTHKVDMDMDFYTAVDELAREEEETGAGMMGTIEFNSACFYRYAVIHWEKLVENLGGDSELARKTVSAFTEAAIRAIPTGKQNTFAAHNPPSLGFAVVREEGAPWSLANAFEAPARANGKGLVDASIEALDNYYGKLAVVYGGDAKAKVHFCLSDSCACGNLGEQKNAREFVDAVIATLPEDAS